MKKPLIPLGIFAVLIAFLGIGLTLNPKEVPSPLIDKPAPTLELQQLNADTQFHSQTLLGQAWVLNIWASWCTSCRQEHKLFNQLAEQYPVNLVGLNFKDQSDAAKQWLQELGNPYQVVLHDPEGKSGIDWGVYGVPETFVVDHQGIIRHKFTGPVSKEQIENTLVPLLKQISQEQTLQEQTS